MGEGMEGREGTRKEEGGCWRETVFKVVEKN